MMHLWYYTMVRATKWNNKETRRFRQELGLSLVEFGYDYMTVEDISIMFPLCLNKTFLKC